MPAFDTPGDTSNNDGSDVIGDTVGSGISNNFGIDLDAFRESGKRFDFEGQTFKFINGALNRMTGNSSITGRIFTSVADENNPFLSGGGGDGTIADQLGDVGGGALSDINALRDEANRPIDSVISSQLAQLQGGIEGQLQTGTANLASQLGSTSSPAFAALASRLGSGAGAAIGAGTAGLRGAAESRRTSMLQTISGLSNQLAGIGASAENAQAQILLGQAQLAQQQSQFEDSLKLQQQQAQLAFLQFQSQNPFLFGAQPSILDPFNVAQASLGNILGLRGQVSANSFLAPSQAFN